MRVGSLGAVPEAVAHYLAAENLPAELVPAPDPSLDEIPWSARPLLRIRRGRAEAGDAVSLTPCFAAVAETGTLMLISGAQTPTTLNFLPDTHIVVVRGDQVVAAYEDGWERLRARWNAAYDQFHYRSVADRGYRAAHRARGARPPAPAHHPRRRSAGNGQCRKTGDMAAGWRRTTSVARGHAGREAVARARASNLVPAAPGAGRDRVRGKAASAAGPRPLLRDRPGQCRAAEARCSTRSKAGSICTE